MAPAFSIRPAQNSDAQGLIELMEACFRQYPGCILDVDGEEPQLRAIETAYRGWDGKFWVAEDEHGRIVGSIGIRPAPEPGGMAIRKLYVSPHLRRQGLATRLCDLAEKEAVERGATFIELWSDTRFTAAHALYENRGYTRLPETRDLHDRSNTTEYHFRMNVVRS